MSCQALTLLFLGLHEIMSKLTKLELALPKYKFLFFINKLKSVIIEKDNIIMLIEVICFSGFSLN